MDINWHMRQQLVIERHRDLLVAAEHRRAVRQAQRGRWLWFGRRGADDESIGIGTGTVPVTHRPPVVATFASTPCR
jgi:hypothetical protein